VKEKETSYIQQNKGRLTLCRNGLLRLFTEGNRRKEWRKGKMGKKSEPLLDDCKETRRYSKLQDEALDRPACKT